MANGLLVETIAYPSVGIANVYRFFLDPLTFFGKFLIALNPSIALFF
ncbi:MAG: hypothetical protein ACI87E_000373 [Mariniblastus sp.]|jgi:hypothetical protein